MIRIEMPPKGVEKLQQGCPSDYGLKDIDETTCYNDPNVCKECWKPYLKEVSVERRQE